MREVTITTDQGKETILVPTKYEELTLRQLLALQSVGSDPMKMFCALTGLEISTADNSKVDEEVVYTIIAFLQDEPNWKELKHPKHLVIEGKPYKVPSIVKETLGQAIMLSQLINNSDSMVDVIPEALAIYFQPSIDKSKFDRERLPEIKKMILDSYAIESYATAHFFLRSKRNLERITYLGSHLLKQTLYQNLQTMGTSKSTEILQS